MICHMQNAAISLSSGPTRTGRSLGRLTENGTGKIFILVMQISADMSHLCERWIEPSDVLQIREVPMNLAAFFFAAELPHDSAMMRRLMDHGTTSESYVSEHENRVRMFRARDRFA